MKIYLKMKMIHIKCESIACIYSFTHSITPVNAIAIDAPSNNIFLYPKKLRVLIIKKTSAIER